MPYRNKKNSIFVTLNQGDLSEWSNEQAWKVCIRASVSRVRIPQSPPSLAEASFCGQSPMKRESELR
ncbi:MAG: hypothetical protein K0S32_2538 [Bacteroidetes bacterium]|nr:hypothetical protein [Bacteroidota bacterium]